MKNRNSEEFVNYIKGLSFEIANSMENINPDTLGFIIQNKNNENDIYVLMSDDNYDNVYMINIFYPEKTDSVPEWAFSYNDYLYEMLASGYEIKWINDDVHPVIWEDISYAYDEESVKVDKGMQLYMKYCKENGITYKKVEKLNVTDKFLDIMKFYNNNDRTKNKKKDRYL